MQKKQKALARVLCVVLSLCCVLMSAPLTYAEGLLQLVIDDNVYNRVILDAGSLELYHWKFDASEDKLTLKNFGTSSSPKGQIFAFPYGGAMTIELIGDNYIRLDDSSPLLVVGDITFTGTGRLTVYSNSMYCISTDYSVSVTESASLHLEGMAGIMALKGFSVDTTGSVIINATRKAIMAQDGVRITGGNIRLRGTNGLYASRGNVFMSGGDTTVEITGSSSAIYLAHEENYVEWSANGFVRAGATEPGSVITSYNNEKYFHASFSGIPKLNVPRRIYWDETVFSDGDSNPVGRWSAVENAVGYEVKLYYYNQNTGAYSLKETVTVTDGLSCNFDSLFTTYGLYYYTVRALGDGVNYLSGDESAKSATGYRFTGEIASRYYVSLPTSPYYTIHPLSESTVVYYGDDYSFTIEVDPAYSQTQPVVRCNGARVALRHGLYTIDDVTSNLVITVDDPTLNRYNVNVPVSEAYVIRPLKGYSTEVEHGGDFVFSFDIDELYRDKSDPVVYANGVELDLPLYGIIYTISNITEDQTITVTGLIRDNYDVSFCQTNGELISTANVDHGYPVPQPADPTGPAGTTFRGWFNKDGTPYDFSTPVTDYTTVYARYEAPKDADGVYQIATLSQLEWFAEEVKFGNSTINGKLVADITMNEGKYVHVGTDTVFTTDAVNWAPIGGYDYLAQDDDYVRFYGGVFDGNGHTLRGFTARYDAMDANASYLGIFGITTATAQIKNLTVEDCAFDGYSYIGGVVGKSDGTVTNCTSAATCRGVLNVGGIAGAAGGDVTDCVNSGSVTVERYIGDGSAAPLGGSYAGGIVGLIEEANVTISGCSNSGTVNAFDCAGGIVGCGQQSGCELIGCTNSAAVVSESYAGGLGAKLSAPLTDCSNTGRIEGAVGAAGLIAVCAPGQILRCFNTGEIVSRSGNAAGLAAMIDSFGPVSFRFCYNVGTVTAKTLAGGLAAELLSTVFENCYSYGAVTAKTTDAFIVQATAVTTTKAYYVKETFRYASCGAAVADTHFYSGWLAYDMNRSCGLAFWAQGDGYPVFADGSHPAFEPQFDGTGDYDHPYLITNEQELRLFADLVNLESGYEASCWQQAADITLHNAEVEGNFDAIGSEGKPFRGIYDGGGFSLSGLHVQSTGNNIGLFGCADSAYLQHITLQNGSVSGGENVGMLLGFSAFCAVTDCRIEACTVSGVQKAGGLVGYLTGDVSDCYVDADVSGAISVGGLIGMNEDGTVYNCYAFGSVSSVDRGGCSASEAGGLLGNNFGSVECCGATGSVTGVDYVGGFCGINYSSLLNCYASGVVTATGTSGGFCADDQGADESMNCYYNALNGESLSGTAHQPAWFLNGITAYALNHDGDDAVWTQGSFGPVVAADEADAIRHTVRFYSYGAEYDYVGAPDGGSPVVMPPNPNVDNVQFVRWDQPLDNITENVVTHAVFEQSSFINLAPMATVKIVRIGEESILVGIDPDQNMTVGELRSQIANENIDITDEYGIDVLDPDEPVVSGILIQLYQEPGVYEDLVTVVIFGDLDKNNVIDDTDAFLLNLILGGMISPDDLGTGARFAADLDMDGDITQNDLTLFHKHLLKDGYQISQRP